MVVIAPNTEFVRNINSQCCIILQVRQPLSKNDRTKTNTILIIEVHARDIIDAFVRDRLVRIEIYVGDVLSCVVMLLLVFYCSFASI